MTKSTLIIVLLALLPALASASQWDIQQLADELEHASNDLSRSAKAVRGFSSVGHNANRLSNKAEQLAKSITRGRSSAYVRTRFTDVSRHYQRVENAFLSARRSYGTHYVDDSFDYVANLYANLSYEFYGEYRNGSYSSNSQYYNRNNYDRGPYYNSPLILINPSRNYREKNPRPPVTQRNNRQRDDYDHRSPVIQRQIQRDRNARRADQARRDRDSAPANTRGDRGRNDRSGANRSDQRRDNPLTQRQDQPSNDRNRSNDQNAQGSRDRNNDTGATRRDRSDNDRTGNDRTDQSRDNPVMQRQNQRDNNRNTDSNRNDQTRLRAPSNQSRNNPVTQRQNQRNDSSFGRAALNSRQNSGNSAVSSRSIRSSTSSGSRLRPRAQ